MAYPSHPPLRCAQRTKKKTIQPHLQPACMNIYPARSRSNLFCATTQDNSAALRVRAPPPPPTQQGNTGVRNRTFAVDFGRGFAKTAKIHPSGAFEDPLCIAFKLGQTQSLYI